MIPVDIYTDGSSSMNGKPECIAGWAFVIPNFNGKLFIRYGHLPAQSSNNKGEIMGVLLACDLFSKQSRFVPVISSDSQYVVNSCCVWRKKWAITDYVGVKNINLLKPLFDAIDRSPNTPMIKWVRGHDGNVGNELADKWCGMGKKMEIININDATQDIKFIPHTELPYDLKEPTCQF